MYNLNGSGQCDLMELSVLLAHLGVSASYWQLKDLCTALKHEAAQVDAEATAAFEAARFSQKLLHTLLERVQPVGLGDVLAHSRLGFRTMRDPGLRVALQEFSAQLWCTLLAAYGAEVDLVKNGSLLIHSTNVRALAAVVCALEASQPGQPNPPWLQRYCLLTSVLNSLWQRVDFPQDFVSTMQRALAVRSNEGNVRARAQPLVSQSSLAQGPAAAAAVPSDAPPATATSFVTAHSDERTARLANDKTDFAHLDNVFFSAAMDEQLLQWKTMAPDALKLPLRGANSINLPRLRFETQAGRPSVLEFHNDNRTVAIRADASEENTWVVSDTVLTEGLHYWALRCDAKGSFRRYVGVGVGRVDSQFPAGTARLLSDGHLKSASLTLKVEQGFQEDDIIGVLLDMDQYTVSFDVNGVKRVEIALPDMAPGEGVRPLAYLFSPKDRVSGRVGTL